MSEDVKGGDDAKEPAVHDGSRVGAPEGPPEETHFKAIILEKIDPNLFIAKPEYLWKPPGARAVFGGQVLGQALAATSQTVAKGLSLHSLHAYFVRAGQPQHPIVYDVKRIRDGKSFATRQVAAKQEGHWIFTMQASFQRPEGYSVCHQAVMPPVPSPDSLPTEQERHRLLLADPGTDPLLKQMLQFRLKHVNPIDVRVVLDSINWSSKEAEQFRSKQTLSGLGMPSQLMWFRVRNRLPDDEYVHHAVLAYQSDAGLLGTARVDIPWRQFWQSQPMMASLDHAMWFHQPFPLWRADEWLLYVMYSPRLSGARGLSHGHIFTQEGRLVVSCTQEGLIRLGTDRDLPPFVQTPSKL
eukprot:gb/GFBE01054345.1/.p1 GENE.gb/GFBE01054345.1/~~gb/GFBE01054345.1/.p1  ORF type:complete len:354 (+),score=52.84 gb/GFBE01054345.1/:1-1062(+)